MQTPAAPTPSRSGIPRRPADFPTLVDALDYAAQGEAGFNFYSGRGVLQEALPFRILRRQARQLATCLLGMGRAAGDRGALIAESDGDFVRFFWACQYAALVPAPLPLPTAFSGHDGYIADLRRMIVSAGASAGFAPEALLSWLREATADLDLKVVGTAAMLSAAEDGASLP